MEESRVLNEWIAKAEAKTDVKASKRTLREALLVVFRARFPGEVPQDFLKALERQDNLQELNRWLNVVSTASDLTQVTSITGG